MIWKTSRREIDLDPAVVMGIVNTTPDSFSDGGAALAVDDALRRAEQIVREGGVIIDVGGESTRPGGTRVATEEEIRRVVPAIEAIARRFDIAVSIDTSKAEVAAAALDAGAEIINDISGLRFDPRIAALAAETGAGLVLMHSRGAFDEMHSLDPVDDIFAEVTAGLDACIETARTAGVRGEQIALDVGLGFGKSFEQNLQLIAGLDRIIETFPDHPMLIGASRKSFIGKMLGGAPADQRLAGSLAVAVIALCNGAKILRVHDVKETVATIGVVAQIHRSDTAGSK